MDSDFKAYFLSSVQLDKCCAFFPTVTPSNQLSIPQELRRLHQQVSDFTSANTDNSDYLNYLHSLVQLTDNYSEEADILDCVVDSWQAERGKLFSTSKLIDELYTEFELVKLWVLIVNSVNNSDLSSGAIQQMRGVIRRYSNLPSFWLYLCQLSGDAVKTGYNF